MDNTTNNVNKINNEDLLKYAVGALIILAFLSILGVYFLLFSSGVLKNGNTAALYQATEQNPDVTTRIASLQGELDAETKKVTALENNAKNPLANQNYSGTAQSYTASQNSAASVGHLKIKTFQANQTNVSSGSVVTFTYSAENTQNGASYRLLIQCPAGVSAKYSNSSDLCRSNIGDALPIDSSGSYSVNFSNSSGQSATSIVVLLAYDITDNSVFLRDSRVLTVTILPNNYSGSAYVPTQPISLTRTPISASAPATISFIATLNNLTGCVSTSWDFGDGYSSVTDAVCPNPNLANVNDRTRQIAENHVYNQPGTYTVTFTGGGNSVNATVYVTTGTATNYTYNPNYSYSNQYQYPYNYSYNGVYPYYQQQPIYNYVPQPYYVNIPNPQPVYVYQNPVNNVPNAPTLATVSRNDSSGIVNLAWSSSGSNVYYRIFRSTVRGDYVNDSALVGCASVSINACVLMSGSNDTTYSLQAVDTVYDHTKTYYYRVKAYNSYGASDFSNEMVSVPSSDNSNNNSGSNNNATNNNNNGGGSSTSYSCNNGWVGNQGDFIGNGDSRFICNNGNWVTTAVVNAQSIAGWGFAPTQVDPCTVQAGKYSPSVGAGFIVLVNGAVPASCGSTNNNVVITSFTINGQTAPTVDSGSNLSLSYGGSYVSSYKLFIQCPTNVSAPDQSSGADMCRANQDSAITVSNSGSANFSLVNLSHTYQTVAISILGLRSDGSVGNSITRYVTVRNQPGL